MFPTFLTGSKWILTGCKKLTCDKKVFPVGTIFTINKSSGYNSKLTAKVDGDKKVYALKNQGRFLTLHEQTDKDVFMIRRNGRYVMRKAEARGWRPSGNLPATRDSMFYHFYMTLNGAVDKLAMLDRGRNSGDVQIVVGKVDIEGNFNPTGTVTPRERWFEQVARFDALNFGIGWELDINHDDAWEAALVYPKGYCNDPISVPDGIWEAPGVRCANGLPINNQQWRYTYLFKDIREAMKWMLKSSNGQFLDLRQKGAG